MRSTPISLAFSRADPAAAQNIACAECDSQAYFFPSPAGCNDVAPSISPKFGKVAAASRFIACAVAAFLRLLEGVRDNDAASNDDGCRSAAHAQRNRAG